MTEAKCTPGPWKRGGAFVGTMPTIQASHGKTNLIIAHVDNVDGFSGETDANINLMTAAPELLAALIAILAYPVTVELPEPLLTTTRAAISKATGEGN